MRAPDEMWAECASASRREGLCWEAEMNGAKALIEMPTDDRMEEQMSLELLALISLQAVRCPACGASVGETRDYEARWVEIPQVGGKPLRTLVGEEVTLICRGCGWNARTRDWRQYVKAR